jgi:hypothetical protein
LKRIVALAASGKATPNIYLRAVTSCRKARLDRHAMVRRLRSFAPAAHRH